MALSSASAFRSPPGKPQVALGKKAAINIPTNNSKLLSTSLVGLCTFVPLSSMFIAHPSVVTLQSVPMYRRRCGKQCRTFVHKPLNPHFFLFFFNARSPGGDRSHPPYAKAYRPPPRRERERERERDRRRRHDDLLRVFTINLFVFTADFCPSCPACPSSPTSSPALPAASSTSAPWVPPAPTASAASASSRTPWWSSRTPRRPSCR